MWYDVGSISVTNGSTTITGTGTDFISGVQVGEGLYIGGDLYEIATIVSGTQLTLADAYLGSTATGQDYKIIPTQSLVADLSSGVADLISDFADVRDYAGSGKFNDGTASSPAITFTQDQNNGLYRIGSDNWGLVAGGDKQLEIKTTGVKLDDNKKVTFGAGDDLQIFHDGSASYIKDEGQGNLVVSTNGNGMFFKSGSEEMFNAYTNGAVNLYHDNSKKLATTSTGVDVTGTVTADGLEFDYGDTLSLTSGATGTEIISTGFVSGQGDFLNITPAGNSSSNNVLFKTASASVYADRMKISSNGDVSFYEDTGTTAKMVWSSSAESLNVGSSQLNFSTTKVQTGSATSPASGFNVFTSSTGDGYLLFSDGNSGNQAYTGQIRYNHASDFMAFGTNGGTERMRIDSAGNVGIGTASPLGNLHISSVGDCNNYLQSSASGLGQLIFSDGAIAGKIAYRHPTNSLEFTVNGSEAARIDSSGNLLVGTTTASHTTAGTVFYGANGFSSTRVNDQVALLNRTGTDGAILDFRKDGVTVGSIGTGGALIGIGGGTGNLGFFDATVVPMSNTSGGGSDGIINLGNVGRTFKHLYLSGGVLRSEATISIASGVTTTVASFGGGISEKFCGIIHVRDSGGTHAGASAIVTVFTNFGTPIIELTQTAVGSPASALSVSGSNIQFTSGYYSTRNFKVSITPFSTGG
jgi:hypothetical protein